MPARRPLAALCLAAALAACGGEVIDPGAFELDGRWEGASDSLAVVLTLSKSARDVDGEGTLTGPRETLEVDVSGRWQFPAVTLVLSAPGYADTRFEAQQANDSTLQGTLSGSGFAGRSLTLRRRP